MKNKNYSASGIVLARKNYSEGDRILVVFTQNHGKVHLLAKGVRKPKSKKRGSLEVFNHIRFQAVSSKGLDLMTEAEVIDTFSSARKNLNKISLYYYFTEVIGRVTRENEKNIELYELILKYLKLVENEVSSKKIRYDFIYEVLTTLGFWPKGRVLDNPDHFLEQVTERKISSIRVGKRLLS